MEGPIITLLLSNLIEAIYVNIYHMFLIEAVQIKLADNA